MDGRESTLSLGPVERASFSAPERESLAEVGSVFCELLPPVIFTLSCRGFIDGTVIGYFACVNALSGSKTGILANWPIVYLTAVSLRKAE